jgi:hypothetical protein
MSTQIGGKGTVRRKKKRTGNIFLEKKTKESREYEMKIKRINKMIEDISDEEYPLFKKYIEEELEDMGVSIEKHNFLKAYKEQYNECKEDPYAYIFSLLILNAQKPMQFNPNSFPKHKKMFELEHLHIFIKLIYDTESALEKKIYLDEEQN